jgi:hypothetical protein
LSKSEKILSSFAVLLPQRVEHEEEDEDEMWPAPVGGSLP